MNITTGGNPDTAGRRRGLMFAVASILFSGLILPIAVSISANGLMSSPRISSSAAHSFLARYYKDVVKAGRRKHVYKEYLTSNFRSFPGHDWNNFEAFWASQRRAFVESLVSVPGNPAEFTARIAYISKAGGKVYYATQNTWLACDYNYFLARLPWMGCGADNLQIDNTQFVTAGH